MANHPVGGPKPIQIQDNSAHSVPGSLLPIFLSHNSLIFHLCLQPLPPPPFHSKDTGMTVTMAWPSTVQGRGSRTQALGICFSSCGLLGSTVSKFY